MIYLDDTLTEDELRDAAWEQRELQVEARFPYPRVYNMMRACHVLERAYGYEDPRVRAAWRKYRELSASYWPVSSRCERGAHGDCMQGAWCLCPCHERER